MTAPTLAGRRTVDGPSVLTVYDAALRRANAGRPAMLTLRDDRGGEYPMDTAAWCRPHTPGDRRLLENCAGPTLDVGCGPGRLTGALNRLGRPALGVDVSATAIRLARDRGAQVLRRDVFDRMPRPGRWRHILLADGNIGIAGDPVRLLRRCRELLSSDGYVHAELAAPGSGSWAGDATVHDGFGPASRPFRWATVAADDLTGFAAAAALRVSTTWTEADRWFATMTAA